MTERAQRIMEAYKAEDTYNFPNDGVAAALRETINVLQVSPGIIRCPDLLVLIEELENLQ
jgi:hypothetical protein